MERIKKIKIIAEDLTVDKNNLEELKEAEQDIKDHWTEKQMDEYIYRNYQHGDEETYDKED